MSEETANKEFDEMRVIVEMGGDLAPYKHRIEELYLRVCGKNLRKCKCKNVLKDAFFEIYARLKRGGKLTNKNTDMTQARLVMGVVLFWGGTHYTNKNLTDEVARQFLEKFPHRKDWFEVLPPANIQKEVVEEVAEATETASESEKVANKPTAPKKKKTAKKRK